MDEKEDLDRWSWHRKPQNYTEADKRLIMGNVLEQIKSVGFDFTILVKNFILKLVILVDMSKSDKNNI